MTTTASAQDNAPQVIISENGRKGDPGDAASAGSGFNQVRKALLDNPLCHLFKTNKLVEASAPTNTSIDVTWLRSTIKKVENRYGIVETIAIDTPSEESEGFLFEGASTNLFTYSEDFTNAVWVKTNATVTPNSTTAPDGNNTATRVVNTAAGAMDLKRLLSPSAGETSTAFWVKSAGTGKDEFRIQGSSSSDFTATDEWVRYSHQFTSTGANANYGIRSNVPGDDVDIYIWGGQLEMLPFSSSYIKTVASTATRTADIVTINYENNFPSLHEYSIYCDVIVLGDNTAAGTSQEVISNNLAGDDAREVNLIGFGTDFSFSSGSAITQDLAQSFTSKKSITAIDGGGSLSLYVDASLVSTISSSSITDNLGTVTIGADLFGHISSLIFYDFVLNSDEITYLSGV